MPNDSDTVIPPLPSAPPTPTTPLSPPVKRKQSLFVRILKTIAWIIATIICLICVAIVVLWIAGILNPDIGPIDDSDLSLPVVSIPDVDNAYAYLVLAGKAMSQEQYDSQKLSLLLDGKAWDEQFARSVLAPQKETVLLLASAVGKPKFQDPIYADASKVTPNLILPSLNSWRAIGRWNNLFALLLAHNNKPDDALLGALISVEIGNKIENSQSSLIEWLIGRFIKKEGLLTIQHIVATSTPNTQVLIGLAAKLKTYQNDGSGLANAYKVEYQNTKNSLQFLAHGSEEAGDETQDLFLRISPVIDRTNFYFHPNETYQYLADNTRIKQIGPSKISCEKYTNQEEAQKRSPRNLWLLPFTSNALGKVISDVLAVSLNTASLMRCQENMWVEATRIVLGVKAYTIDTKKKPESLDILVPNYLESMPLDPFTGEAFKYDPAREIIYSLGLNRKDVGGSPEGPWDKVDNPTFSVAFH